MKINNPPPPPPTTQGNNPTAHQPSGQSGNNLQDIINEFERAISNVPTSSQTPVNAEQQAFIESYTQNTQEGAEQVKQRGEQISQGVFRNIR
ncbi:MAG: hypothetical protein GDA50_07145 [Alphaproteobacteria bacterium GM202ARS2]|nr:hypothetical protein [Alphaproteobacteria bacterium GM202ARS2]